MGDSHEPGRGGDQRKRADGRLSWRRLRARGFVENVFFLGAAVFSLAFAAIVLRKGIGRPADIAYLLGFYLVLAYLALPRVHRILSALYVPDYFIGRTRTSDGLLGDPVNLALLGDEQQVRAALERAGWVLADPVNLGSSVRIIEASLMRRSYTRAPVSTLLLFGRQQDLAYQQEADGSPTQRHHVRLWRCPDGWLLPGGYRVDWLAAGTYDRAVGLSAFTLQVTHKIDADIDAERDHIVSSVREQVPGVEVGVIENFSTGYHSRNGGGDEVRTDGALPVLDVRAVEAGPAAPPSPPEHEALGPVGKRPVPVIAAFVLTLAMIASLLVQLVTETMDELTGSGGSAGPGRASLVLDLLPFVPCAALMVLLAWLVFRGFNTARMLLLFTVSIVLAVALAHSLMHDTGSASLVHLTAGVLIVYALTSLSTRSWVYRTEQRRRERRAARPAAGLRTPPGRG